MPSNVAALMTRLRSVSGPSVAGPNTSGVAGHTACASVVRAEDQAAGRHAGAGGDQHVVHAGDLVDRSAADLAHGLGDAVHAVDVRLAELSAVRVERQPAVQLDRAVGDEVPGLAARAEAQLLELDQDER